MLFRSGEADTLTLQWNDPRFPMPLPVRIDGKTRRVAMPEGKASIEVPHNAKVEVDPQGWVMKAGAGASF